MDVGTGREINVVLLWNVGRSEYFMKVRFWRHMGIMTVGNRNGWESGALSDVQRRESSSPSVLTILELFTCIATFIKSPEQHF